MTEYAPGEVKYRLATLRNEVGEMALTYIHELEQINSTTLAQLNYNNGELIIENEKLRKDNEELKKKYEDSLVACGILKEKIDLMTKPSPIEAMQDVLITAQKEANKKQNDQLTKAKEIIKKLLCSLKDESSDYTFALKNTHPVLAEAQQFLEEDK